jgi:hypothetical protein
MAMDCVNTAAAASPTFRRAVSLVFSALAQHDNERK